MSKQTQKVPTPNLKKTPINGRHVRHSSDYRSKQIRKVLRSVKARGVIEAARRTDVSTGLICAWCRMAGIDYSLPKGPRELAHGWRDRLVKDLDAHPIDEVILWYGITRRRAIKIKKEADE